MSRTGSTSTKKRSELKKLHKKIKEHVCFIKGMAHQAYSDLESIRDSYGVVEDACDKLIDAIEKAEDEVKGCRIIPRGQR